MQCPLCPNADRIHPEAPVYPEGNAPMSTLPCGHQVHTHCLINEFVNNYARTRCGTCDARVVEERVQNFYDNGDGRPRQTVVNLWATSEEFRNDIKELKKRQLKYNRIKREFNSAAKGIKDRFLNNIRTSMEVIRDQKQVAKNEYRRIPCKRVFNTLGNSFIRKLNQIRGAYGIGPWELRRYLPDIPGAPKFTDTSYYRWRSNPAYFFRIRI
jgi:hypothetical protein